MIKLTTSELKIGDKLLKFQTGKYCKWIPLFSTTITDIKPAASNCVEIFTDDRKEGAYYYVGNNFDQCNFIIIR